MQPRRILILTNRIPYPLNDGGNLAVHAMMEGYQKAGWQVYLLSMLTTRHPVPAETLNTLFTGLAGFQTVPVNNDVKAINTLGNYLFSRKPNHVDRLKSRAFELKLREVLGSFKPDIVQMESVFLAPYLDTIEEHKNTVNVLRLHNVEHQIWERLADEVKNPFKKMYLNNLAKRIKKFEIAAWKRFDLLLPITKDDAAIVHFLHHQVNMLTAPFGIDVTTLQPQDEEQWVGYHIGAMDWIPNAEAIKWFLSQVWPQVMNVAPNFKFYFAGRNMPDYFKGTLPAGTYCAGEVEDANEFIADKKILIVPLRSGGGIRVKILEAMAVGKLVISTDVGMQGIAAINGQHYLAANSARQFKEAIRKALSDKAASERIAAAGKALIHREYRLEAVAETVIMAIEELL
jgi:glycosyltransferase involved in cell wall biosynthesis